jgi:hypothetical protein
VPDDAGQAGRQTCCTLESTPPLEVCDTIRLRAIRRTLPRPSPATFGYRNTGPVLPFDGTRAFPPPLQNANRSLQTRARRARDGSPEKASCLSPYVSSYPPPYRSAYADLCRALRRHLRLLLNGDLYLDRYHEPHAALNCTSFRKPFEKPNPTLLRRLYGFGYRTLFGLVNPAAYGETQPPGRPVGR